MIRRFTFTILLLASLFALGCATGGSAPSGRAEALNPTLTAGAYMEDGKLLTLVVGTRAAKHRDKEDYVPIELALAIKGLEGVTLTRESFTLVDDAGNSYPVVSPEELRENYRFVDQDHRLGDILPVSNTRFLNMNRVPSNFSPGFDDPIDRPRLHLPRYNWAYDFLYFPKPEGGVQGRRFELHMTAAELPHPILVKFKVR